jgi:hypothetical protein
MRKNENANRELRNVLRSGNLAKGHVDTSKPKLTLDLSNRVFSMQGYQLSDNRSTSRKKCFVPNTTRNQNKENEFSSNHRSTNSARSRDMLDSYRSSRNTHYLQRNDIFKYVKPGNRDEFDFRASTSFKTDYLKNRDAPGLLSVPPGSQNKGKVMELSPTERSVNEVAKRINFNQEGYEQQIGGSLSSISAGKSYPSNGLGKVLIPRSINKVGQITDDLNFGQRRQTQLFANRRLSGKGKTGSSTNAKHKLIDEFSDPYTVELEEPTHKWERRHLDENNESSIKLQLSYHDVISRSTQHETLKSLLLGEGRRASGTEGSHYVLEEITNTREPSDCVLISADDPEVYIERVNTEGRTANLESMKTIKEVEEKEEIMGYTSQKESQQSNFNQGSFQNLIDKYCKNKDTINLATTCIDSSERANGLGFTNTQALESNINEMDAIQEEELNAEIDYRDISNMSHKIENIHIRAPDLSLAQSTKNSVVSKSMRERSMNSGGRNHTFKDLEAIRSSPFSIMVPHELIQTEVSEERSISRGHSRSQSNYSRVERLDQELENILRTIESDYQRIKETCSSKSINAAFRNLDGIQDPNELKEVIRDLELENREREAEIIKMNMQMQDMSRLARVLVRKLKSHSNN